MVKLGQTIVKRGQTIVKLFQKWCSMENSKRILILCTGNSCRSQMAEAFVKQLRPDWQALSAGTKPGERVHPKAVQVMQEVGIDISGGYPKRVDQFLRQSFDYVITVCDHARESCPVFFGDVKEQLHIGFEDPVEATGSEEEVLAVFRRVRDEIREEFSRFIAKHS